MKKTFRGLCNGSQSLFSPRSAYFMRIGDFLASHLYRRQRPAERLAQIGGSGLPGATVSAMNSWMIRRISIARSVTASFWYKRRQWVRIVWGETPRSVAMANSVQSSKMPHTIWSSRVDSLNERAISSHACPDSIVEHGAGRRERPALPGLTRLFTPPHMDWTNYVTTFPI